MVGLPDATVRESRDRVRSAIKNSGFEFPPHRITVNLTPADVRKAGSSFALPIALGLLATSGQLTRRIIDDTVVLGELSLDGAINGVRGVLPVAIAARRLGVRRFLLPPHNAAEACVVDGLEVYVARSLPEALETLNHPDRAERVTACAPAAPSLTLPDGDLVEVWASSWRDARWKSRRRVATTCCYADRPAPARRCWPEGWAGSCRHSPLTRRSSARPFIRCPGRWVPEPACSPRGRSAPRTTRFPTWPWSAAAPSLGRARSPSRITACSSSTRCRSSTGEHSKCCASRSRTGA